MTQKWNLQEVRKLAGIPLTETWDRDDFEDEDPDVKIAAGDKRQQAFEKRNKKELADNAAALKKRNADQKAAAVKKAEEKKEEAKAEPKAEEKKEAKAEPKAEEKKEEAKAEEAKRRGRAPNPESFNQKAKALAKDHTRASFIKWAAEQGKGVAYASAMFAKYNPKSSRAPKETVSEVWMLSHPFMPSYLLAEGTIAGQTLWVDPSHPVDPMIFESESEAQRAATYMREWKGQSSTIVRVAFDD